MSPGLPAAAETKLKAKARHCANVMPNGNLRVFISLVGNESGGLPIADQANCTMNRPARINAGRELGLRSHVDQKLFQQSLFRTKAVENGFGVAPLLHPLEAGC